MRDVRCIVGLHDYAPPQTPAGDRATSDHPGLRLECTRCRKAKEFRVAPPNPGPGTYELGQQR